MRRPQSWWRAGYRDNPVLQACSAAGMTAEQALEQLARSEEGWRKRALELSRLQPAAPIVVATEPGEL